MRPSSLEDVDSLAAEFIESAWHEGDPKLWCTDLLASLHFYLPAARRQLHCAWGLLKAWNRFELPCRACPITLDILFGLCGALTQAGFWRDGVLAAVAFHLLLRTGEIFTLQAQDLVPRPDGTVGIVRLRDTKGQKLKGASESVVVQDVVIGRLLTILAHGLDHGDGLLQCRSEYWRYRWNLAVKRLHLEDVNVKAYSLRRGGCTAFFRQQGNYDKTVERGRWTSVSTARRYLDDATSSLAELRLPPETHELLPNSGASSNSLCRAWSALRSSMPVPCSRQRPRPKTCSADSPARRRRHWLAND